jgi:peptidoglycan/LPS O-acetylase OafA/YrhL
VLVFHYQHFAFVGTAQPDFAAMDQPFYSALRLLYSYGFYGVQVFWCISGFIFYWKYAAVLAEHRMTGRKFFVLRLSRLYPLHFATLLLVALLQPVYLAHNGSYFIYSHNDLHHFVLQLFMASNWGADSPESFNGPIWSISIEVLVYCIFFLSLRYVSASLPWMAAIAAGSALVRFLNITVHPVFTCMMFFYLGCLTAIGYMRVKDSPYRLAATAAALVGIAGLLALQAFVPVKPVYFLLVFSPALIFLCVTHIPGSRIISTVLVTAGSMTYSSYLLHVPIQLTVAIAATYARWAIPIYSSAFFLCFLAGTLLLSYLCYRYFEMPAQNYLRRRFK